MFRILMSLFLVLGSTNVIAKPVPVGANKARVMVIDTAINNQSMKPLIEALAGLYGTKGSKTVDLVLNSPGGSVVTGFEFLSLMSGLQAQGWTFRCTVYHVAASMAYQILNQCDQRQSLNNSFLLWHRARIYVGGMFGAPMTAPLAQTLADGLTAVDDVIFSQLQGRMGSVGATEGYLSKHFEAETLHIGSNLSKHLPDYIDSYFAIPGLVEALKDATVTRTVQPLDFFGTLRFGEIIYIWE